MKSICCFFLSLFLGLNFLKAQAKVDSVVLAAPDNWRTELIPFPLGFAPEIDLQGFEDIRFSSGWANPQSPEFWTYAFAWSLENHPGLSEEKLSRFFEVYFDGLMSIVSRRDSINPEDIPKTQAAFKLMPEKTSTPRYRGEIQLFDAFFSKKVMVLFVKGQYIYCEKLDRHFVFFELSPQAFDHDVWAVFNQVKMALPCH
ncbi:MAG: hypothetical protein AAFU64_00335 [Bacteroidota bacterium]